MVQLLEEFEKRQVKVIALACESVNQYSPWLADVMDLAGRPGHFLPFPIITDEGRDLSAKLRILDPNENDSAGVPLAGNALIVIDPKQRMRQRILYPAVVGRNFK